MHLFSCCAVYTFSFYKLEVKANENVKDNGSVEELTSQQRTEINIVRMWALLSTYPAIAAVESHINQTKVIFIRLLNYLLTDNKGGIYVAIKTSVSEWSGAATEATLWIGCNKTQW